MEKQSRFSVHDHSEPEVCLAGWVVEGPLLPIHGRDNEQSHFDPHRARPFIVRPLRNRPL